ncbi:hypothetical protein EDB85DRAFT_2155091 [Lactarius pseudohatsudake]|nr:hypothetical protein EDB85DRAFT_2155091 [Lactarius pseudohatsudake]
MPTGKRADQALHHQHLQRAARRPAVRSHKRGVVALNLQQSRESVQARTQRERAKLCAKVAKDSATFCRNPCRGARIRRIGGLEPGLGQISEHPRAHKQMHTSAANTRAAKSPTSADAHTHRVASQHSDPRARAERSAPRHAAHAREVGQHSDSAQQRETQLPSTATARAAPELRPRRARQSDDRPPRQTATRAPRQSCTARAAPDCDPAPRQSCDRARRIAAAARATATGAHALATTARASPYARIALRPRARTNASAQTIPDRIATATYEARTGS